MNTIEKHLQTINEYLAKIAAHTASPRNLYEPVEYVLSFGGKRIRPLLTMLACEAFAPNKAKKALPQAAGIEIFHNFTLLHDDVMDNSDMRRNQPTVHKKWNANTAILSGDAMLIEAYKHICNAPADKLPAILRAFNNTALGVCEGQQYDMDFETRDDVTLTEYFEMIRLKTAVLLAGALEIGAIIGGASVEEQSNIYNYGIKIGLAFQLQDDLLDLYGNEQIFGKPIGSDIRENKKTYLYLKALTLLQESQKQELTEKMRQGNVDEVSHIYNSINIKQHCEKEIENLYTQATEYLNKIPNNIVLKNLGEVLINREK
jgi:geranylgeranyl diphosphate synthase type II